MLSLPEPERDRWLWGAPILSREELRAFEPDGASTEEVVLAAVGAARLGDRRELERLLRAAQGRAPEDPTVRALYLLGTRNWGCCTRGRRPTDAEVVELTSLAERSAFARYVLVRVLVWRRDTAGARRALEGCPPEQREAPSVAAAWALTEPSTGVRLRRLRELRSRWPAWRTLLDLEVWAALYLRDLDALDDAYRSRCALLGRRPWHRPVRAWARAPFVEWPVSGVFGIALALGWWWLVFASLPLAVLLDHLTRHVVDSWPRNPASCLLIGGTGIWMILGYPRSVVGGAIGLVGLGMYGFSWWAMLRARRRERARERNGAR
jgi:hypothetical protein